MKRTIILHGHLRKLISERVELEADTVAEAISGLSSLYSDVLRPLPGRPPQALQVIGYDTEFALNACLSDSVTELHLTPAFRGGKSSTGMIQIVIGVVLILVAVFVPGGVMASSTAWSIGLMGASMVLGGVMAMLSPAPKMDTMNETGSAASPEATKYLGQPKNTTKIGTRIPVFYGVFRVYGQLLSADVQAADVAA